MSKRVSSHRTSRTAWTQDGTEWCPQCTSSQCNQCSTPGRAPRKAGAYSNPRLRLKERRAGQFGGRELTRKKGWGGGGGPGKKEER
eukprot:7701441-Pyramimonas_sp.AAC.1